MLFLRIRQAETALGDGRLDEAYGLVQDVKLRAHRRGQDLIGRLARALVARGRQHLADQRWPQALADCEKAAKLGGNLTEAADLHKAVSEAAARQQSDDRRRAEALAAARKQMDNGRLSMCEGMLADLEADSARVATLKNRADAFRAEAQEHLDRARAAVAAGQWDAAIDNLVEAKQLHASSKTLSELTGRVVASVTDEIDRAVNAGRLDRADALVRRLRPLAGETVALAELAGFLGQCRRAQADVERGMLHSAGEALCRLAALRPEAVWLRAARQAVEQAAQNLQEARGGPLGLLAGTVPSMAEPQTMSQPSQDRPQARPADPIRLEGGDRLPSRFLLHVDGAGSYLVVRDRCVTIGPVSSAQRPDVGLMAEPHLPVVTIERNDEDYFLVAQQGVTVNDKPVTRKLLADGDTIALAPRCRLKFSLPHAASTTAVVELSGTRLPAGDVRRVVLLDRSLVIGAGSSAHIRADAVVDPIVLHVHDERLLCRNNADVMVEDRPLGRSRGIPVDAHVKIDAVSFVVTRA